MKGLVGMDMNDWSLKGCSPRPEQVGIIDEIHEAISCGFTDIILEAGTGIGKSAIATTVANGIEGSSYILTMTKQLQNQYLQDFEYMVSEIKGRGNYHCNYHGSCEECYVQNHNDVSDEKLRICNDCEYKLALLEAQESKIILTNYDYMWYAGNYTDNWNKRELLVLDETHNFEKKIMGLISDSLNRRTVYKEYNFDIFYPVMQGEPLKSIDNPEYWCGVLEKLCETINNQITYSTMAKNKNERLIERYSELIRYLQKEDWIIELPTKETILHDDSYKSLKRFHGLTVNFKPLMIKDYSKDLLGFGEIRLFLTGTLGNKQRFCHWNGVDEDYAYYIFQKSSFPVEHRPIIKNYVGNMSGFKNNVPNWQNNKALVAIKQIIKKHRHEKGVIHTSSNQQAWWIKKNLDSKSVWVAYGASREQTIDSFENTTRPTVLIGAGIKDGVDFKGDKCRYQIIFKMPKPSIASKQTIIRAKKDPVWYAYQTVMPLMQSYGRGIRDNDDYCKTYVLDSEFEKLLNNHKDLFNEYFLEAITCEA